MAGGIREPAFRLKACRRLSLRHRTFRKGCGQCVRIHVEWSATFNTVVGCATSAQAPHWLACVSRSRPSSPDTSPDPAATFCVGHAMTSRGRRCGCHVRRPHFPPSMTHLRDRALPIRSSSSIFHRSASGSASESPPSVAATIGAAPLDAPSLTHSAIADEFAVTCRRHLDANSPWSPRRKNRSTMRMRWPAESLLN